MYSSGLQVTPRQPLQATMSLCALPSTAFRESYVRFYSSRPPPVPSSSLDENQNETKPLTSKEEEMGKAEAVKRQQASLDTKAEEKLSIVQKFKLMYKQYWYVLIPVHIVTSVVWYGSFYIAAKSGVDIIPLMEKLGAGEKILSHLQSSNAGYYAIAYAMYKIATPARYTVTVGGTTISINYLKKRGYIKPVPSSEQLKEMYEVVFKRVRAWRRRIFKQKDEATLPSRLCSKCIPSCHTQGCSQLHKKHYTEGFILHLYVQ